MIGAAGGMDTEALRKAFEDCIGTGDENQSPVLRLARKLNLAV